MSGLCSPEREAYLSQWRIVRALEHQLDELIKVHRREVAVMLMLEPDSYYVTTAKKYSSSPKEERVPEQVRRSNR